MSEAIVQVPHLFRALQWPSIHWVEAMGLSRAFKVFLDAPPSASVPEHTGPSHSQACAYTEPLLEMSLFFLHLPQFRVVRLDFLWTSPPGKSPFRSSPSSPLLWGPQPLLLGPRGLCASQGHIFTPMAVKFPPQCLSPSWTGAPGEGSSGSPLKPGSQ